MGIKDIYGYKRDPKPEGVFSSEDSHLTFGSSDNLEFYLVQNWQVAYQQKVRELFELGSQNLYWLKGRPQGQGQISRIIGRKQGSLGLFPDEAYDICNGGETISIDAASGQCDTDGSGQEPTNSITCDAVVVTNITYAQQVEQGAMLNENVSFRFAAMDVD